MLRLTAKHEKVVEKLKQLLTITGVLMMDKDLIFQALNSKFRDFEDALQNYTAIKTGNINAILTRNIKDFRNSELGVLTPENYLRTKIDSR